MTMAVPAQPGAVEIRQEIDRDDAKLLDEAKEAIKAWTKEKERLEAKIKAQAGDATVLTVDDKPMYTYEPIQQWRKKELVEDHPELTQHYMVTTTTLDMANFAKHHPEIAVLYQTRAFKAVK